MEMNPAAQTTASQQLREQEIKYRAIIDSIDAGFCIVEVAFDHVQRPIDYRFLEVNSAFERQTGLLSAEGQWMRVLVPDHEEHWFEVYGAVALLGEPARFELPAQALQGRWFEVYAFRVGCTEKHQVAILFNDISDRKRSEAALQQAYERLEQTSSDLRRSNEDLDQFVRMAGHDLQAPVRTMVQNTQLVIRQHQGALSEDASQLLGQVVTVGKRMSRLLDDLLSYAKIAQQTSSGKVAAISVHSACREAIENLNFTIDESSAAVHCRIGDPVLVGIDLSLLTLVLQNLIENSIRYRRPDVPPFVLVTAADAGEDWKVMVQDNGCGIDLKYVQRIFEPFRRLHGEEQPGNGLGLATCKRIVEGAGGQIGVESTVNEGSTFFFTLPKL